MQIKRYLFCSFLIFCFAGASANVRSGYRSDTTALDSSKQRDIGDVIDTILHRKNKPEAKKKESNLIMSVVPAVGYTLSTGFIVDVNANIDFYTQKAYHQNLSYIDMEAFYDSKAQKNLYVQSSIWARANNLRFIGDFRFLKYPDDTYGLGSLTTEGADNHIYYNYLRFYETVLGKIAPNLFMGGGYNLDYHFGVTEDGPADHSPNQFDQYGFSTSSTSSGLNFTTLYDSRDNPNNPQKGIFGNLVFRQNTTVLGSDNNWESVQFDLRQYYRFPADSHNILAFWNMDWFNFNGKAPYLDLPMTGGDTFNNLGRGYEIGRFRGRGLLYLESEYRFHITSNGLFGGVVFANGQSFSEYPNGNFDRIIPAIGTGLRVKVNKHSNTNLAVDYAYGFDNSKGFFVNLGEMF